MSYPDYAQRCNSCSPITPALTSNAKFLPPNNPVYDSGYTNMMVYPGTTGFKYPFQHNFGPDVLKAWNLYGLSNRWHGPPRFRVNFT
jgi:hypothetical protein